MSIQRRSDELVDLLRPDFVGNDGTASPTFTDEYLTGSHRASVSVGVRVFRGVVQTIGNAAWTAMIFDTQRWDDPDDNQWAIGTPTRLTCQFDGIYVITGHINWQASAVGRRHVEVQLGGATRIAAQTEMGLVATSLFQSIATTYKLSATDFVELRVWQNSGGNLNVDNPGNYSAEFSMARVA